MPDIPELIRTLSEPSIYPHPVSSVVVIQTQMSVVFLAGEYAYKVKKPVNLGYLDYSRLNDRRYFCEREVELNQRLCSEAYLGVVTIKKHFGKLNIDGKGEAVEYAVKMRRLPEELLMDQLLSHREITTEMIDRLARRISDFHKKAKTGTEISRFGSLSVIKTNNEENLIQAKPYIGRSLSSDQLDRIAHYTHSYLEENHILFEKRVKGGYIRDCHGDLHSQHICFCFNLCIFDCIEFNDRFRYGDTASEVAFLAMDLEHAGQAALSREFVQDYIYHSGDTDMEHLIKFYKCYRACIRGKVNSFKIDDPNILLEDRETAMMLAQSYFNLADAYSHPKPLVIIMSGMVGSGKTTLALELAQHLGMVYLSSDVTRKKMAGLSPNEHRFEPPYASIYSPEFTRRVYDFLYCDAVTALGSGYPVVIDASFLNSEEKESARQVATRCAAKFFIVQCTADEATIIRRLENRKDWASYSDGRWEIYIKQKERTDSVSVGTEDSILVDTTMPIEQNVRRILQKIL